MAKGSQFERDICHMLSEWWTDGERTDIFWRTAGSGARATTRGRKGKTTKGQHGDICAIDPIGQPFLDRFCVELKNGYNYVHLSDIMARGKSRAIKTLREWISKAERCRKASGATTWVIVHKRDYCVPVVYFPFHGLSANSPITYSLTHGLFDYEICSMPLADFLKVAKR